jgi:NADH dehydrogenase
VTNSQTGTAPDNRPHVVVVGGGFAGIHTVKALAGAPVRVTLIDRRVYNTFQPLLYQVATGGLNPGDVTHFLRALPFKQDNVDVVHEHLMEIDTESRRITLLNGEDLSYDYLVLANGVTTTYFGTPGAKEYAFSMYSRSQAIRIRDTLFTRLEKAAQSTTRHDGLRVVIVGGGPTGVEMAGAVAELARYSLARDFRHIDPKMARILLVESGPEILQQFPKGLQDYAAKVLTRLGVTVMTGHRVEAIRPGAVTINGNVVRAGTVVWGAGVKPTPVARWLGVAPDRAGRVVVGPDLSVPGLDGVFVVGDAAAVPGADGKPLPALAQVAHQQGTQLGRGLRAFFANGTPLPPFRFHNRGNTAVIGRNAAVFDFGRWRLKGWIGWMLWGIYHIYLLTGFDRRLLVTLQWLWLYITYQQGARLITSAPAREKMEGPTPGG